MAATKEELSNQEYMGASAMVDSVDEKIVELAHSIDGRLEKMRARGDISISTSTSIDHAPTMHSPCTPRALFRHSPCTYHALTICSPHARQVSSSKEMT